MNRGVTPSGNPQRIIELKLPLPYLLSLLGGLALLIVGMYYRGEKTADMVTDLREEIRELKAEVKSGNGLATALSSTVALLQFRLETAESDIRVMKDMPRTPRRVEKE